MEDIDNLEANTKRRVGAQNIAGGGSGGGSALDQNPHLAGQGKGGARGAAAHTKRPKTTQPRHGRASTKHREPTSARTMKIRDSTERSSTGNGGSKVKSAALVKDLASVGNVALAFGLREDGQGGGRSFEEDDFYNRTQYSTHTTQYSVSNAGGESSHGKGAAGEQRDPGEPSRAKLVQILRIAGV